ncbi:unnamed protein product [Camellia sinensis]
MLSIETNNTAKLFDYSPMPEEYASSSAEQVAANDDLLTEILIRLPLKSLPRFKSVSKHWFSLISSPHFTRTRNVDPSTVSGLFLHSSSYIPNLGFIPVDTGKNATSISFPGLSDICIINSCYGLILCKTTNRYHILNPLTKQFTTLPDPHPRHAGLSLAFDPSRSPHYKVVCVWGPMHYNSYYYFYMEIYASETGSWRASGEPLGADMFMHLDGGVYWNGAINCFCTWGNSKYFNIDEERVGILPMIPGLGNDEYEREYKCYVESRGHLHLVQVYGLMTRFNVYEMERDYSGWSVKYHVDLDPVGIAFPEMMHLIDLDDYSYVVLTIVRGEKDEDSFMVLHVPGKVIRYNLVDRTFRKICDVDYEGVQDGSLRYSWYDAFQYIESTSSV